MTGFALGVISCPLLAIVEYAPGPWCFRLDQSRVPVGATNAPIDTSASDAQGDRENSVSVLAADGVKLAGSWHPATGLEPTGRTVILLHGFAESPGNLQAMRVAALNAHGWNAAVLDLRGYGRSEGPFASFGGRESGDVRVWLGHPGRPAWPGELLSSRCSGAARWVRPLLCAATRRARSSKRLFSNRRW